MQRFSKSRGFVAGRYSHPVPVVNRTLEAAIAIARSHFHGAARVGRAGVAARIARMEKAHAWVADSVQRDLTDAQRVALVVFAYEVGPGERGVADGFLIDRSGHPSAIRNAIAAGEWQCVGAMIEAWEGGVRSVGDQIRRSLLANMVQPATKLDEVMRWEKT